MTQIKLLRSQTEALMSQNKDQILAKDTEIRNLRVKVSELQSVIDGFDNQRLSLKQRYSTEVNSLKL